MQRYFVDQLADIPDLTTVPAIPVYIKMAGYGRWGTSHGGMINNKPNGTLYLTNFLVLHLSLHVLLFVYTTM